MKIKSLIPLLSLLPLGVIGQVTLKSTEDFTIGTTIKYMECDTTGVKPGFTGPKQTWDFSKLTSGKPASERIVAPEKMPNASMFPKANLVEKNRDGSCIYVDKEANNSFAQGFVSADGKVIIQYTKPMVTSKRPVSFGGTNSYPYTDKYTFNNVDYTGTGMVTIAADGYGTLSLPDKKYSDVLRIMITQKQKDTPANSKEVKQTTTVTYVWYDAKHKSPLLRITYITSPTGNSRTVEYLTSEEDK